MAYQVKDPELTTQGDRMDGISSLAWSPKANFIVAGSWDSKVRCWDVQSSGGFSGHSINSTLKLATISEAPVLCCNWSGDGSKVFFGGCDNKARIWTLQTNQVTQIGQHDAPIKGLFWIDDLQVLMTGSWDKSLRYWDGRQQNPVFSVTLPERVYSLDVKSPLCVVGTAERHIVIYDLRKAGQEYKRLMSPLKYQTRVVSCFPDKTGFAVGSIEGRVGIQYLSESDASRNFAFKCHRENNTEVFSVNSIAFHPVGIFATAGSDGSFHFWDKDSKQRLKQFGKQSSSISTSAFSTDGNFYSYAVSYDWSKGNEHYNPNIGSSIHVHQVTDQEIKKDKTGKK